MFFMDDCDDQKTGHHEDEERTHRMREPGRERALHGNSKQHGSLFPVKLNLELTQKMNNVWTQPLPPLFRVPLVPCYE